MLFWFVTLAIGGLVHILHAPEVLAALDPRHAVDAVVHGGLQSAFLLGAVVLAVTGVEALYADMGHFGRLTISRAWHCIVLPSLILNYLGLVEAVMPIWQRKLFGALSRNMSYTPNYFFIPYTTNRRLYLDDEGLAGALVHESKVSRSSWRGLLESPLGDRHAQLLGNRSYGKAFNLFVA